MSATSKTSFIGGIWGTWPSLDTSATDATATHPTNNDFDALPNANLTPERSIEHLEKLSPIINKRITNVTRPAIKGLKPGHWDTRPNCLNEYDCTYAQAPMPHIEKMVEASPAFRYAASVLDEPLDQTEEQQMLDKVTWLPTREPRPFKIRFDPFRDLDEIDFNAATTIADFEDDDDDESSLVTPPETMDSTANSGRSRSMSFTSSATSVPTTTNTQPLQTSKEHFQELVKELSAPFKAYMHDRNAPKPWSIEPSGPMTEEAQPYHPCEAWILAMVAMIASPASDRVLYALQWNHSAI
ncbi:hypothetical protein NEOLEDRAFT_1238263 [Neolentinus lepideus HHB14362 ss-1]|uniref:Uncharacterized protein n=1 Tax=Neolentinus lepideus HHB14362 ss-1 TaxID=1314782 RepID=A0A165VSQ4_9AGAM|nr:hypothetical protein NEOLEDRAFT_1238263 [Neolentinus lepideus HHB14362 ss-1]